MHFVCNWLQYLGNQVSDRVRLKCIELLYGWSQVLSHEPKVREAYQMLKKQGIIKYDPIHIDKVRHILSVSLSSASLSLCSIFSKKRSTENELHHSNVHVICCDVFDSIRNCYSILLLVFKLYEISVYALTDVGAIAATSIKGFYFWRWWKIQSK